LTQKNICIIFISCVIWDKFRQGTGVIDPVCIFFPDYSKETIQKIICNDFPHSFDTLPKINDKEFFAKFVKLELDTFYNNCHDLIELSYHATVLYPKYCEPIELDPSIKNNPKQLYIRCQETFKTVMDRLFQKDLTASELLSLQFSSVNEHFQLKKKIDLELPMLTKYLLIAAFLASYNPQKYDIRYFSSQSLGIRHRPANAKYSQLLLGPKVFDLNRMLAIFSKIQPLKSAQNSAEILHQISSLVSLKMLQKVSGDVLDVVKFKCNVTFDFIQNLSANANFPLFQYLHVPYSLYFNS